MLPVRQKSISWATPRARPCLACTSSTTTVAQRPVRFLARKFYVVHGWYIPISTSRPCVQLRKHRLRFHLGKFAGIGSNSYGSTLASLTTLMESLGLHNEVEGVLNPLCKACFQLIVGAPFLEELNTPNDTVPGVQVCVSVGGELED